MEARKGYKSTPSSAIREPPASTAATTRVSTRGGQGAHGAGYCCVWRFSDTPRPNSSSKQPLLPATYQGGGAVLRWREDDAALWGGFLQLPPILRHSRRLLA